jgi:hypothetical protein
VFPRRTFFPLSPRPLCQGRVSSCLIEIVTREQGGNIRKYYQTIRNRREIILCNLHRGVSIVHHHGSLLSVSTLESVDTLRIEYVFHMHDEILQHLSLGSVDIDHYLKFFYDIFDFPLEDSLRVYVKKWNV